MSGSRIVVFLLFGNGAACVGLLSLDYRGTALGRGRGHRRMRVLAQIEHDSGTIKRPVRLTIEKLKRRRRNFSIHQSDW